MRPPESVLMSMAHVATKGHKEAQGSGLPPVAMLVSGGCAAAWPTQTLMTSAATQGHGKVEEVPVHTEIHPCLIFHAVLYPNTTGGRQKTALIQYKRQLEQFLASILETASH